MEKIKAIIMLEILGKPAKHVKKVLGEIVEQIGKIPEIRIVKSVIANPKQLEKDGKKQDAFTSFAEIELETNIKQLMFLVFNFTPSHIEIIEPETIELKNFDLNSFFNDLVTKIHYYDEAARTLLMERQNLMNQLKERGIIQENPNPDQEITEINRGKAKKKRKN